MADQIRQRILTFALVGHGLGGERDPIAALFPFLAPIAGDFSGQRFDPVSFRAELRTRYGIALSRDVTEVFVQRLISLRLLRRSGQAYMWQSQNVERLGAAAEDERRLNLLVDSARRFHDDRKDLLGFPFEEEPFLDGLMSVVLARQQPIHAALAAISAGDSPQQEQEVRARSEMEYLASEFIAWSKRNDRESFEWIAELAGAAVVAESLIEIRTPALNQSVRPDLFVYLDAPIAMEFLGCSGRPQLEDTKYLINSLREQGVGIGILRHSLEELQGNIRGVLGRTPNERSGPTAVALLRGEVDEAYLRSVLRDPDYYCRELGVQIADAQAQKHLADERYFTSESEHGFFATIQGQYDNPIAAERDAASIAWVLRRRKGARERDLLKAKFVLLTRNALLYQRVRSYRARLGENVSDFAAPVVLARDVAGILWLLLGQQERLELSKRQLLLQSQRARANSPQVVDEIFRRLRSVNQENADLFWAAVRKPRYLSYSIDSVLGAPSSVTDASAEEVLERIRTDLVAEERRKAADDVRRLRDAHEQEANLQKLITESLEAETLELRAAQNRDHDALRAWVRSRWNSDVRRTRLEFLLVRIFYNLTLVVAACVAALAGTDFVSWPGLVRIVVVALVAITLLYLGNAVIMDRVARYFQRRGTRRHRAAVAATVGEHRVNDFALAGPLLKYRGGTL